MNAIEIAAYQDNIIKVSRDRWLKRWNNPLVVWTMRLSVIGMWASGMILWYYSTTRHGGFGGAMILLVSIISGPRFLIRELRHKN